MTLPRVRIGLLYSMLLALLSASALAAIAIGSTRVGWDTILRVIGLHALPAGWVDANSASQADKVIVWLIRIPRVIVAAFTGAGLATAGAVMQALFRNPLAEPGLAGAGAGAVLGAVVSFVAGWSAHSIASVPVSAMTGSLAALTLVYLMSTRGGVTPVTTLLLAGIATSSLLSALSTLLISLNIANWQIAQEIVFWMMGGLDARTWTHVWMCAPFVALGFTAAMVQARDLDLIQQGEETAMSLGVDIEASKRMLMLTASFLTGAAVAVAGMIGFVGLVVPHAVRLATGPSNRKVLPASALGGAAFLILCDLVARTVHPPIEIRLGVVTALIGGPIFLSMLVRRNREAAKQ